MTELRVNATADYYVVLEDEITGANSGNDGTAGNASISPALQVGYYNATPPTLTDGDPGALQLDSSGKLLISVATLPLPTGAATAANQSTGNAHLNKLTPNVTGAASATNGAATVTISAPGSGQAIVLQSVHFGFSANPAATALLTVTITGLSTITVPVTAGGAGFLPMPLEAPANTAVSVSLAAGGSGVIGYCNAIYKVVAV